MSVIRALLYLRLVSLRNFWTAQARRLRQPKYLLGTLFVAAYFWFFVFRHVNGRLGAEIDPGGISGIFGAVFLTAILASMWTFQSDRPGLRFTEAEIAFLFPAPLTRRMLLHYKLAGTLFSSLVQAMFFGLIFHRGGLFDAHAPQRLIAWWALLSVVSLHGLGASLTVARLAEAGWRAWHRRLLAGGVVLLAGGLTIWWIWSKVVLIVDYDSFFSWLAAVLDSGAMYWLLRPAHLLLQPLQETALLPYLIALVQVLAVITVHYWWVLRQNVSFEEASLARAAKAAALRTQIQTSGTVHIGAPPKGRPPPFDLARFPWPETAFLWKNLLSTRPWLRPRTWVVCAALIIVIWKLAGIWLGHEYWKVGGGLAGIGSIVGAMSLVYGPLITRLDVRQDLVNTDILKTYPLPGWRIVLGQLLTPVVILTALAWLGLLAWYLGLHGHQPPALSPKWFSAPMRTVFCGCIAAVAPFLLTLQLLVPNGAAILFPAIFRPAQMPTAGGLDLMGQRMIFGFGQMIMLLVVLLPGIGVAGLLIFLTQWFLGPALAIVLATLLVILVFVGEIWCVLWWLGQRFEKLDISSELRP